MKGAFFLGFGSESVVKIKCDESGRMIHEELERAIKSSIKEVNNSPMEWRTKHREESFNKIGFISAVIEEFMVNHADLKQVFLTIYWQINVDNYPESGQLTHLVMVFPVLLKKFTCHTPIKGPHLNLKIIAYFRVVHR